MSNPSSRPRGDRNASWLVLQRSLAIVRRLLRGPATKKELLEAVRLAVGPEAYSASAEAAAHALKNDRAALAAHLGIQVAFDRHFDCYRLTSLGETPWLDLDDDALAAIATIDTAFVSGGPEAERVRAFLDQIKALLPPERLERIRRPAQRAAPGKALATGTQTLMQHGVMA